MNANKPVAWMQVHYKNGRPTKFSKVQTWEDDVPLYTHPAKTLTDEEIKDIWCEVYDFKSYDCLTELDYKFCREIIRKAQEK
jgi:hypothetical protein